MKRRLLSRVAVALPLVAAMSLAQPASPAHAADNCGNPFSVDFDWDTYVIRWTSQACLRLENVGGVATSYRGLGLASFNSDSAAFADIATCTVFVTVYQLDGTPVTSGTANCNAAAQSNGSVTADAGPTPVLALPVCGPGRFYYAESHVNMSLINGNSMGHGATRSFTVFC